MLAHMRRALREVVPGGQPDAMIETAISQSEPKCMLLHVTIPSGPRAGMTHASSISHAAVAQHKAAVLAPSVDSV